MSKVSTHEVFNQTPPLSGYSPLDLDETLRDAIRREGAAAAEETIRELGRLVSRDDVIRLGFDANENVPRLRTHDRTGHRIDEVEFHPAWHELMSISARHRLHNLPWAEPRRGAHVARAAMFFLAAQNEFGHLCPVSMTYASFPTLQSQPELAKQWEPRLTTASYDRRFIPPTDKSGVLFGMAMTEKQGGSDVRANTTRARAVTSGGPAGEYTITGHKWFCSAPMCDAFFVLAVAPGGLSCFLLPRWTPDGRRNGFFLQRLKHKMGNRSNASAEVELDNALAWMVGEEGRGVRTIIDMVNHTRLDCALSSAGSMRQAVVQAVHHSSHRAAFGKLLIHQPLMQNVLADLVVESEAATMLVMRLAGAFDRAAKNASEAAFRRAATAVTKYWICKRAPVQVGEALECLGGNGYVEESIMPRLYREVPLNSLWEGCGNVICLDVLRAMETSPESLDALLAEVATARGDDARFDDYVKTLEAMVSARKREEKSARRIVERLALALQASLLLRFGDPAVTEAFVRSRLDEDWGRALGTLPVDVDHAALLERARTPTTVISS